MAECALNRWGKGRFKGFSAGSKPKGAVHPITLELLRSGTPSLALPRVELYGPGT
jgi:arsenate reductase